MVIHFKSCMVSVRRSVVETTKKLRRSTAMVEKIGFSYGMHWLCCRTRKRLAISIFVLQKWRRYVIEFQFGNTMHYLYKVLLLVHQLLPFMVFYMLRFRRFSFTLFRCYTNFRCSTVLSWNCSWSIYWSRMCYMLEIMSRVQRYLYIHGQLFKKCSLGFLNHVFGCSGIGYGIVILCTWLNIYYIVVLAWSLYYFGMSFTSLLPWSHCDNEWNTPLCTTGRLYRNCSMNETNELNVSSSFYSNLTNINQSIACNESTKLTDSAEEFWR